jgi:hypothetical protein
MEGMKLVVAKFRSFEDAEQSDLEYYRRLSPIECLEILFQLRELAYGDEAVSGKLARVYRITKLNEVE